MFFPCIKTNRNSIEQAIKILEEIDEFIDELDDEECVDILHAAETLIRVHFKDDKGSRRANISILSSKHLLSETNDYP